MSFFARLFAPTVAELESKLGDALRLREWYKFQAEAFEKEKDFLAGELKKERLASRKREDQLTREILKLAGANVPVRETLKETPVPEPKPIDLLSEEEKVHLWGTAEEYCIQRIPNYTEEDRRIWFSRMCQEPAKWLT